MTAFPAPPPAPTPDQPFTEMAERIKRNQDEFGGAFVIVLPGEHEPVVSMIVTPNPDAAVLLSNAMNQIDLLIKDLKVQEASNRGYR
jgi:hypothetical protein